MAPLEFRCNPYPGLQLSCALMQDADIKIALLEFVEVDFHAIALVLILLNGEATGILVVFTANVRRIRISSQMKLR